MVDTNPGVIPQTGIPVSDGETHGILSAIHVYVILSATQVLGLSNELC